MSKAGIHPTYYPNAVVTCSCGASHTIGSTKEMLKVDICKECHPFYSGTQKLIDTAGRVDRFRERMLKASPKTEKKAAAETAVSEVEEASAEESRDAGKEQE